MADHVDAAFGEVCDVFGFKTLDEHQKKNALKFVVEKKKDGFVNQLLFFKPCRCCMHVSRCVEQSREKI